MRPTILALAGALLMGGCGSSDPTPTPRWFFTCGDPVCRAYTAPPGLPACTAAEVAGEACRPEGTTCDPRDSCNRRLACATSDPTGGPAGCPISRAAFKTDIVYLDDAATRALRDDLLAMRLATWRYREEGVANRRLGFLIDDIGAGPAVTPDGDHVDLYGYTSLAVAAIQEQQREIAALREELATLRKQIGAQPPRPAGSR